MPIDYKHISHKLRLMGHGLQSTRLQLKIDASYAKVRNMAAFAIVGRILHMQGMVARFKPGAVGSDQSPGDGPDLIDSDVLGC